jgi:ABC-2 type transport system permease protein
MAAGIYGAILGVSALVKEESEGTIEFLYSKPITRSKIVTAKLSASVLIFYMFIIILGVITMGISFMVKPEDIEVINMLMDIKALYIGMAFLGYIFMAIGFLISVFIKTSKQAVPIALAVFFTSYLIGIFGKLKDNLNFFLYFSPFDYVVPAKIIKNGFETKYLVLGLCIIIISIIGTYLVYNKKDFR